MIKEINQKIFNDLSKYYENTTFYQTSNWAKLKSFTGWEALYLGYFKNDKLEALGLFLLKKMPLFDAYLAYSPRGYLIDYNDSKLLHSFNNELLPYLKNKKVFQLVIDPYLPLNKRDIYGKITVNSFDNTTVVNDLINIGYKHTGYNLYYENLNPRWLFRLNIKDKSFEELLNGFKKEAKRRALKKDFFGISVRELKENEVDIFKDLMNKTSKRKGFIDRPLSYYQQMYKALSSDGILRYMVCEIDTNKCRKNINLEIDKINKRIEKLMLHESSNEGKLKEEKVTLNSQMKLLSLLDELEKANGTIVPLSVVCLLTFGKEAIMLLAGNDEKYLQHFNTSNIIVSELIKLCKNEGYTYYNFYGITGNFDPKSESYGLYTYKRQYGGEVVEMIGQFEYYLNKPMKVIYDLLLKVYQLTK